MRSLPFGKHRGTPLEKVPTPYLRWVLSTVDLDRYPGLRPAIEARLALGATGEHYPDYPRAGIKQRVDRCYREMALLYHPDRRGGSTEAMVAINTTFERLRESLELE
jgi:hypothetical protein